MFITPAYAQAATTGAAGGGGLDMIMSFAPILIMVVIFWFLIFRPQQKRMKEHQKLISEAKVGDHVIMEGGEHGIITSLKDRTAMIKIADNVKVEYERTKIAAVTKKTDVVEATPA